MITTFVNSSMRRISWRLLSSRRVVGIAGLDPLLREEAGEGVGGVLVWRMEGADGRVCLAMTAMIFLKGGLRGGSCVFASQCSCGLIGKAASLREFLFFFVVRLGLYYHKLLFLLERRHLTIQVHLLMKPPKRVFQTQTYHFTIR
jgi:hypothetical protein